MKAFPAILIVAILMSIAPLSARSSGASPLIGTWAVDVSRLPIPPQSRPKSVTFKFGLTASGAWSTTVDIVDAGGSESHAESTTALDGTAAQVSGSNEADTIALKMPTPNVLVMALEKGGVAASTRIYAVAADGKTMVETAVYFGENGLPIMRTNYFTRVR